MKIFLWLTLVFLCGCASSERMARLSGGVIQNYSVPQDHRLRSEKFQKKAGVFSRQQNSPGNGFSERSLINIWPFFFRSDDYYSALWPLFDYDPYGFALRPFFNKEGDDYSVLFPLSAWNTVNKDGWITLFYWGRDRVGLIPVAHYSSDPRRGMLYLTPLFIRNWQYNKTPDWYNPLKKRVLTSLVLAYYQKTLKVDISGVNYLHPAVRKGYPQELKEIIACKLHGTDTPVPRDLNELNEYRKKVFAASPEIASSDYGFVPLFFGWNGKYHSGFNIAGILLHYSKTSRHSSMWSLCRALYTYSYDKNHFASSVAAKENWAIPPLMLYGGYKDYPKDTPQRRDVLAFRDLAYSSKPFSQKLPELKKYCKRLTGKEMPHVICNDAIARTWIEEYAGKQTWLSERERYGGFLPLYCFFSGRTKFFWTIPALLTFSSTRKDDLFFLSIPLLTYWRKNAYESVKTTAWRLGYYNRIRKTDRITQPVFDRKTWWVKSWQQHHFEDTYALGGLYYHGRDGFSVARKGLDARLVESVRRRSFELKTQLADLEFAKKRLDRRKQKNAKWKTRTRLEELQKMVDTEEIRIAGEKWEKDRRKYEQKLLAWSLDSIKAGFKLDRTALDKKNFNRRLQEFLDATTDIRYSEDFGSGIFFRKELAENRDHKWHIFAYLASGSKQGEREKTQVLHFLYRRNRDGDREEKIIFPFIAIRKSKKESSTSFLWRLWEVHETPAGKGGYIFFIPWGK